jgi:hypothetical protein
MKHLCALLVRVLPAVLLATARTWAADAPELEPKDLAIDAIVQVPAESTLIAARSLEGKTIVYVAVGATILFAEEGATPMRFATLPAKITRLMYVNAPPRDGVFALTENSEGYLFAANGAPTTLIKNLANPVAQIAFTSMSLYHERPHGIIEQAGQGHVARFAPAGGANAGKDSLLAIDARLGVLAPRIVALGFVELPWHKSLLGLTDTGELWRIDSLGKTEGWVASKSLAGGRFLAVDTLGILGGGVIVSVPAKSELWSIGPDNSVKRLARGLDLLPASSPCQGALAMTADGVLCVLAGQRVLAIAPPKDGPLAQSVRAYRQAERLYKEAKWQEALARAQEAVKTAGKKTPKLYLASMLDLVRACEGAPQLERAKTVAEKQGWKKLLASTQKLEQTYGQSRLAPELALTRKRCEVATNVLIITDFEDKSVQPDGMQAANLKVRGSFIRRAAAPDPVKEGLYSLKWQIPAQSPEGPSLSMSATVWGHADEFLQTTLWVYSARDRFQIALIFLNGMGQELARYPVALKKGWQQLTKPPMQIYRELQPLNFTDLTVCGMLIEALSRGANDIFLDDARFITQKQR